MEKSMSEEEYNKAYEEWQAGREKAQASEE
jgi:hypothetical protein